MVNSDDTQRILIIGGGFGGVSSALALERKRLPRTEITVVSDKSHFEYQPALWRAVTGKSPREVCIPLQEVFRDKKINFVRDAIEDIDIHRKIAQGSSGSQYHFDYALLALGSETAYFDIAGLKEFSFGFKSITEALRLKRHIHHLFETCSISLQDQEEDLCRMHFVVVGSGASGVEFAGGLAVYAKTLAKHHGVDDKLITIDLIEAAPRILPMFAENVSLRVSTRLRRLGINIFTNRPMEKESLEEVKVRGVAIKTETVIWTAGTKPNSLYQKINGLNFDKKGRVMVDEYLQTEGFPHIFVVGDGASTKYSGMAQTAIHDGQTVAANIGRSLRGKDLAPYRPKKPYYAIPVGPGWAAAAIGPITLYGIAGWLVRRIADFRFFSSILPFRKAVAVFREGKTLCEACEICMP